MNDALENRWIERHIDNVKNAISDDTNSRFLALMENAFRNKYTLPFVACFSTEKDVLSQWRAYAADATGVSIGFDFDRFPGIPERIPVYDLNASQTPSKYKIIYDSEEQTRLVSDVIEKYARQVDPKDPNSSNNNAGWCAGELVGLSAVFKNPAFAEENEWRIMHTPYLLATPGRITLGGQLGSLFFRNSANDIVPYFRLGISSNTPESQAIVEVVLGSKCKIANWALQAFLERHGFMGVDISRSNASYR